MQPVFCDTYWWVGVRHVEEVATSSWMSYTNENLVGRYEGFALMIVSARKVSMPREVRSGARVWPTIEKKLCAMCSQKQQHPITARADFKLEETHQHQFSPP